MKPLARAWQILSLLSSISYLKSFKSSHHRQHLLPRNNLQDLFRSFSSSVGYAHEIEMSNLEETEFYLYSDSIDNKLIQGEYNPMSDPFLSSSRGVVSRKGPILDSTQLDNKTLELMIRKETENAVRSVSLFGGLLSILVTRDIWYAASSFLIVNIFATQANGFGTVTRIIGARIDLLVREIGKVGRLLTEFCFKGDIERNSFKELSRGSSAVLTSPSVDGMRYIPSVEPLMYDDNSKSIEGRTVEKVPRGKARVAESKYYYDTETPEVIEPRRYPSVPVPNMAVEVAESVATGNPENPVMKEVLKIIAPVAVPKNSTAADSPTGSSSITGNASSSNPSRIPLGTLISSAAKSTVTIKRTPAYIPPPPSAVYAATATISGKVVTVGGVPEAVRMATLFIIESHQQ
jgi:hypothetical protein